ncbi:hypothetical protein VIN01S_18260 [Vibrio inusitatus NBRC 102082]|uniref:DUF306 domain-containing protein n=1 Tax=Vibrio inusitatus NBRC 102082 TaxID=1219070 RepID=A0A4Y3HW79_9VIBR|nr:hypothetical protein [Vibrio inusitatus]GEA51022.1 hypothetical protein VIN01S_18260 [Vibrio inusitatus NBRC 102082]
MPKTLGFKWLAALIFIVLAYFSGRYINQEYIVNHERVFKGIWEGTGVFTSGNTSINSSSVMIIEPNDTRVAIKVEHNGYAFTVDANVTMRHSLNQHVYGELNNRTVTGLDKFVKNTGLLVPRTPSLLVAEVWRLDEGRLFINIMDSGVVIASFPLQRKHAL